MGLLPKVERTWPVVWSGKDRFVVEESFPGDDSTSIGEAAVCLPVGLLRLRGRGVLAWLNSFSTQDLTQLPQLEPGDCLESLILTAQGHIQAQFMVTMLRSQESHRSENQNSEDLLLLTENPDGLAAFLKALRFGVKVQIENLSDQFSIWGMVYSQAPDSEQRVHNIFHALAKNMPSSDQEDNGLPAVIFVDPWPGPVGYTTVYAQDSAADPHPGKAHRFVYMALPAPKDTVKSLLRDDDIKEGTLNSWEAVRIAAWRPRIGTEADPKSLPHESDWLRTAVHLRKGCYVGQETVAKIVNLGMPPRRLTFLNLDGTGENLPTPGQEVLDCETNSPVGVLTSVAYHPWEGPIGLGLLRRCVDPQSNLLVGNMTASQQVITNPGGDNPLKKPRPKLSGRSRKNRTGNMELGLAPGAGGIAGECGGRL